MVSRSTRLGKPPTEVSFASPPWDERDRRWREIDARLPEDHLARWICEGVDRLDLEPLFRSYQGRGSPPLRPDLMLKVVMYEFATGQPSPADWFRDTRERDPVKWLGFGIQPSRSACYEFRDRLAPYWDAWNEQVLHVAREQRYTSARRVAQDGTTIAACASRHKLANEATLARRIDELDEAIVDDEHGTTLGVTRGWMANHPDTRCQQLARYKRASQRLKELQIQNQQRRSCDRRPPEKIVVSLSDPDSVCGRDKLKVFRPLYNVQLHYDVDSPFILGYEVFPQTNDNGTLEVMLERTTELVGVKPEIVLADATYASILDLEVCEQNSITLYAPVSENDYSKKNGRKPQTNRFTQLPKSEFTWLPEEATYLCPEGHRLHREKTSWTKRSGNQRLRSTMFRCSPEHCRNCPRRDACTAAPSKGRTVSRMDNEELLDTLRERMKTDEAKQLYRLRGQTVERAFADMKQHRNLRCLAGRGLDRAKAQVAATVLANNLRILLQLEKIDVAVQTHPTATRTLQKLE
jgi:transposase